MRSGSIFLTVNFLFSAIAAFCFIGNCTTQILNYNYIDSLDTPTANPFSLKKLITTFIVTATDMDNCVNSGTVDVLLIRNTETGPQHHINDVW